MAGPLSYEPSVQAILTNVLPAGSRVVAGEAALRRRVSWPVLARTTGLGEIEGGEFVLVPLGRGREVLARLHQLAEIGIAALAIADSAALIEFLPDASSGVPVLGLPEGVNVRRLLGEIERYIARRRRDLFALDQELHHALVDAAIAGVSVPALLSVAGKRVNKPVAVDRDGDLLLAPDALAEFPTNVLSQARIASHGAGAQSFEVSGPPRALALPIVAGRERRGIALLLGNGAGFTDEDEAVLSSLASACAISLAREPTSRLPHVSDALDTFGAAHPSRDTLWTALAIDDGSLSERQLERALRAEVSARTVPAVFATDNSTLVVLVAASESFPWSRVVRALISRLGSTQLRAAVGRPHAGPRGARRSAQEALETLPRAQEQTLTLFASIELQALLDSTPRWSDFARARLEPLLTGKDDDRELVHTLHVYLLQGRNARAASEALQVHRNTLLYRLRRIERRLNVDLDDAEVLFELDLATRIATSHPEFAHESGGSD